MSSEIRADADHKRARAVDAMERDFQGVRQLLPIVAGRRLTPARH